MERLYIQSDNAVQVTGLKEVGAVVYINDATVVMTLCTKTAKNPNAAAAVDKSGGLVGIPCTGHMLTGAVDRVRIQGTQNYDGEYELDATTSADELVVTATYVAETFGGEEKIYVAVRQDGSWPETLYYVADSDGDYRGDLPDSLIAVAEDGSYYLFITAISGAPPNDIVKTWRLEMKAVYFPNT